MDALWIYVRLVGTKEVTSGSLKTIFGGRHGIRTHDPGVANAVLSQLS
jgi:hypothetical protein